MAGLSNAVRSYRFERMREFMAKEGFDALVFTASDWFEWASNHPVSEQSWERPYLLVVPMNGEPLAVLSEHARHQMAAEARRGTLWIGKAVYYAESPGAVRYGGRILPQWSALVAEVLAEAGLRNARVGADAVTESLARAVALLPGLNVRAAGASLRSLRWIKHPEELETMRVAASLSDWAMSLYREELRPGRLLAEVDYLVAARLAKEAARRVPGRNYVIGRLLTLSGPTSACPHGDGALNGKVVENDSVAVTTIATRLDGLAMELARTWIVGRPEREVIELFDCVRAAQEAAIEAAVAGRPVAGIHAAAQEVIERAGFGEYLRLRGGHGIGVVMHDYPEDVPFSTRTLFENETYAIEPGLYLPRIGGFRFADAVAVGASAPECLTRATKDRAVQTLSY